MSQRVPIYTLASDLRRSLEQKYELGQSDALSGIDLQILAIEREREREDTGESEEEEKNSEKKQELKMKGLLERSHEEEGENIKLVL